MCEMFYKGNFTAMRISLHLLIQETFILFLRIKRKAKDTLSLGDLKV